MRILAIGDPHFKSDNAVQTDAMQTSLCAYLASTSFNADAVIVLGDILHRHDKIDLSPLKRANGFLAAIRKVLPAEKPLWILIGNHDLPNNAAFLSEEHAFNPMKLWHNTVVADCPTEVVIRSERFLLCPFIPTGRFKEAVKDHDMTVFSGVFAHQEFRGCRLGGITSTRGDVYGSDWPQCISGHIHEFDDTSVPRVIYTGTPYPIGFSGTADDKHSLSLISFNHGKMTDHKRVTSAIAGVPRNVTINIGSLQDFIDSSEALIERAKDSSVCKLKIKVTCSSSDDMRSIFTTGCDSARRLKAAGASVIPVFANPPTRHETSGLISKPPRSADHFAERLVIAARASLDLSPSSLDLLIRLIEEKSQ